MRVLVFEDELTGHHLEFLHHYYMGAISHSETHYVFYVPDTFSVQKNEFDWPEADNISFKYFSNEELQFISSSNLFVLGWKRSLLLKKKIEETKADKVFLTFIATVIPFICFLLSGKVRISGIMYDVENLKGGVQNIRSAIAFARYKSALRSKYIEKIFILNDNSSCNKLNSIFKTDKFGFLVDPAPDISQRSFTNLRSSLNIPEIDSVYLHFGGMALRKGTLEILRTIEKARQGEFRNKTFIFAGRINRDIHDSFYSLLDKVRENARIIVYDEFCTYQKLYDLCYTADVILMPYQLTNLSSGVLGYASAFDKMAIGPAGGLIGELITKNNLGIAINDVSAEGLFGILCKETEYIHSKKYASSNSLDKFTSTIFNVIG